MCFTQTGRDNNITMKRTRNAQTKVQPDREVRRSRLALFIQQFEKEAQERINELEAKMENMLATVDKVFHVELMKMPRSLRNTRMGDLISSTEISESDVSIALKNEGSLEMEMHKPLRRAPSKRVRSTDSPPVQGNPVQRSTSKSSKRGKATKRTIVGSNSTGNVRASISGKRPLTSHYKPKLRSVSTGDLHCSMAGSSAAHITVTTARGQAVSFSEETKHELNFDLLDDVALCQLQKLTTGLMEFVSRRSQR